MFDVAAGAGLGENHVQRYLTFMSSLWAAFAVSALVVAAAGVALGIGGAVAVGLVTGLLVPSPAKILANRMWHTPPSSVDWNYVDPLNGEPLMFTIPVLLLSIALFGFFFGIVEQEQVAEAQVGLAALAVAVSRLILAPLGHGLLLGTAVITAKKSPMFDWLIRRSPSVLTAHASEPAVVEAIASDGKDSKTSPSRKSSRVEAGNFRKTCRAINGMSSSIGPIP